MKTNRKHNDLQIESLEPMVLMSASAADVEGDDSANTMVGEASETLNGGAGDDTMSGVRDNGLCGEEGDDLFITGDGFNTVDGGEGTDTIRYASLDRAELSIIQNADGSLTISDGNSTDIVSGVEIFEFQDQTLTLAEIQNSTNNAPVIETPSHLSIEENQTEVATIVASDVDCDCLSFSLSDAQDGPSFEIDPSTGVLSFRVAPDYENPGSLNGTNVYDVTVRVSDGNTTTLKTFWVSVTDVDESDPGSNNAPTFDNLDADEIIEVNEGTIDVRDIDASDLDGDNITYSFSDGINVPGDGPNQDPAAFNLDPNTGELSFRIAPDFENPADADGDNEYQVTVVISDGQSAVERNITIRVLDVDENTNQAPSFSNVQEGQILTVPENTIFVGDADGSDPDGDAVTFSIEGGADADLFIIDPTTGLLEFISAPDFEAPGDADGNNDFDIVLRISDGTLFQDRNVTVRVTDVGEGTPNNAPSFTNVAEGQNVDVAENTTFVGDANGVDPDGDDVTFSIVGGDDSGLFSIDPSTGIVTFNTAPDFEAPTDADGNNIYALTLRISDGTLFQDRNVTVTVTDTNEGGTNNAPSFTNVAEGQIVTVPENTTLVGDANGSDPDGDDVTFSIEGGADAALFQVDPTTGVVTFISAPDFEAPGDANGDNDYNIVLRVSDGTLFQDRNVVVRVTDVGEGTPNNAPSFTNVEQNEQVTVVEGNTFVGDANGVDPDGDNVTFSIQGGDDAAFFSIDPSTGVVTFNVAPDFEAPADANGDNIYSLTLRISDGTLFQDRDVTVRVLDQNDGGGANDAPSFTNVEEGEIVTVPENTTFVGDANGTDPNGDNITFSIQGGADANLFQIDPVTGVVTFISAPDFEAPGDANGDNDYNIVLRVSDGTLFQDRNVVVRVTDVGEGTPNNAPSFTNVEQNEQVTVVEGNTFVGDANGVDPDGDNVTFSIQGGDDAAFFSIDPSTGVVTFNVAPDFEAPADANGDNIYSLTLRISDGTLFQDRDVTVRVLDQNDGGGGGGTGSNNAPFFTNISQNEVVWQNENVLFVGDANAVDGDGDALTFSIAGGADSSFFQIDAQTGQLFFINAPDFENPLDADGDNRYVVTLRVSDGVAFEDRTVTIMVEDLANA